MKHLPPISRLYMFADYSLLFSRKRSNDIFRTNSPFAVCVCVCVEPYHPLRGCRRDTDRTICEDGEH